MNHEVTSKRTWPETERLQALERYAILGTPPEPTFDGIVQLAADLCEAPIALLTFIASDRQWFKAEIGLGVRETQLTASVYALLLCEPGVTVFPDLSADARTVGNPLVAAAPNLRFYAGALLETADGFPLGRLCVLDVEPRPQGLTERQRRGLATLAAQAMESLEFRRMQLALTADERRRHALRLRESENRYRSIFEQAAVGITRCDAEGRFLEVNERYCQITGYAADELLGRSFVDITHPDDLPDEWTQAAGLASGRSLEYALDKRYIRKDGSIVWVRATVSPVQEVDQPGYYLGIVEDISERKRAQDQERLLLSELQHRVRNTLAVVRGIARRTAENSETVEDFAMHLDGRLDAFARTQAYVTRYPGRGVDLTYLIAEELAAHHAQEGEQVRIAGPELSLMPEAAEKIGLAIHELATNAIKHGALGTPGGHIDIAWRIEGEGDDRVVAFEWGEHVPGGSVVPPKSRGFGTDLMERALIYDLDAQVQLDFTPFGLSCVVTAPLSAVACL